MRALPLLIGGAALVAIISASTSTDNSGISGTPSNMSPRELVVQAAQSQIGFSDPTPYWLDALPESFQGPFPPDWCGAFALWALHQAGLALDIKWEIGFGFLLVPPHALRTVSVPEPGDIAYFNRNQHHAVVESVDESSGTVNLINGNGVGGQVTESVSVPFDHVTAFFSIQSYIDGNA